MRIALDAKRRGDQVSPMTRLGRAALLTALIVGPAVVSWDASALSIAGQQSPPPPVEVGSGPVGDRSLAFVGRNLYRADDVALFGYLTAVNGLDPALLFTGVFPSSGSARFTYSGDVAVSARSGRGDVTSIAGYGAVRIFVDDSGGASWDDPGTFGDGKLVAELSVHLDDTVQRQAPGVGVIVGDGQLTQLSAGEFAIDGERYRFGNLGLEHRLRYVGVPLINGRGEQGQLSAVNLTGFASVTSREAIVVSLGGPATPETATTSLAEDCAALQSWLTRTTEGLDRAQTLGAVVGADGTIASLDLDAVRQAAADVGVLAVTQRVTETPDVAATANRLVVTALSTSARGLQTVSTAISAQNTELLAQGKSVVVDGDRLIGRAREAVDALAAACAGTTAAAASP